MLPSRITVGSTLSATASLPAYPAGAGWVLKVRLVPDEDGGAVTIVSTASGDDHVVTATAAATTAWIAGAYTWAAWVEMAGAVVDVDNGRIDMLPNPRTAQQGIDLRTSSETALENVRAMLRGRATQDVLRYTINGRSLERWSIDELVKLESTLAMQVRRDRRAAASLSGAADPSFLQVRLGRA